MADRRSIRSALARYGDRPDKATTVEHYEAEAAESRATVEALQAEWQDGYRAGFAAAMERTVIGHQVCDHCKRTVTPVFSNGYWYWQHPGAQGYMCQTGEHSWRTVTVNGRNLVW